MSTQPRSCPGHANISPRLWTSLWRMAAYCLPVWKVLEGPGAVGALVAGLWLWRRRGCLVPVPTWAPQCPRSHYEGPLSVLLGLKPRPARRADLRVNAPGVCWCVVGARVALWCPCLGYGRLVQHICNFVSREIKTQTVTPMQEMGYKRG